MALQPLRTRRDYGSSEKGVNPYLNTPPTKLKRDIGKAKGNKKKQMQDALNAWRITVPGPFRKTAALELLAIAKDIMREGQNEASTARFENAGSHGRERVRQY